MKPIPPWLQSHLQKPPAAGTGLHPWIYRTACLLVEHCTRDRDTLAAILQKATADAKRSTSREIIHAVESVLGRGGQQRDRLAWPQRDEAAIARVLSGGISLEKLRSLSPAACPAGTTEILPLLFQGDPLLCIGFSKSDFRTLPLSRWLQILAERKAEFIVPSPMTAPMGITQAGRPSARTNANTGPRHYLVIEFDFKPQDSAEDARLLQYASQFGLQDTRDLCASLAHHLGTLAPLALGLWSGGKSLHCWFPVHHVGQDQQQWFFAEACRLGADRATWTPSQFIRLPWGWNAAKNQQQEVIYFAPNLLAQTPDQQMP
jgi:hypothetical protein